MKNFIAKLQPVFFIITISLFTQNIFSQNEYNNLIDLSGGITDGYGTWGNHQIIRENSVTVPDKGIITFYHPDEQPTKIPTVVFISGWGRHADSYDKFFRFIVSKGYALINIYNNSDSNDPGYVGNINVSYPNIIDMIKQSARIYGNWIDTTKIGLMGHSFGGGATIWVGKKLFGNETNWGANGRFIFVTAPWLSFLVTKNDLQNYPPNVKLHVQVNWDDVASDNEHTWLTDPRAIRAVFELINISDDDKDYVRVFSDTTKHYTFNGNNFTYLANHYLCYTNAYNSHGKFQPYDAMDVYVLNRLADAMMDYVFEKNEAAKNVALGNGSSKQIDNGALPDLEVTDKPVITRPVNEFRYTCYKGWSPNSWKLEKFCDDKDEDGIIDSLENVVSVNNGTNVVKNTFELFQNYPNPFNPTTTIKYTIPTSPSLTPLSKGRNGKRLSVSLKVYNILGKEVATLVNGNQHPGNYTVTWEAANQPSGIYFYRLTVNNLTKSMQMLLLK